MTKKPDDFDAFMETDTRPGIRCRTCALYPEGSQIDTDIRRWLKAKRDEDPNKKPVPSRRALHRNYLVPKCGYSLGILALTTHIERCLGGEEPNE